MANKRQLWNLYVKASKASKLPHECVPGIEEIACDWTIWQFDNAVTFAGGIIENALYEREKVGDESQAKYTLAQLLDDDFRLPRPLTRKQERKQTGDRLKAMLGDSGKRRAKGKGQAAQPKLPPTLLTQVLARGMRV